MRNIWTYSMYMNLYVDVDVHFPLFLLKLSQKKFAKIADVGISKPVIDITGTLAGTPVYITPEVFHGAVYDCKADIYSLGIILWEMWYGKQAFNNVPVKTLEAFFALMDNGCRPEHVTGCKHPPSLWQQLMNKCWNKKPEKRPTAKECLNDAISLFADIVKPL